MKKLCFIFVALVALFTSCSRNDSSLLRAVPDDTEMLARIDMKDVAKSMGYSWTDMLQLAMEHFSLKDGDCGIDLTGTAYAFVVEDARMVGVVLPVSNAEALRTYLTSNGTAVTETDGIFCAGSTAAFDRSRFVIASGKRVTSGEVQALLKQQSVHDDVVELNDQLETVEDPVAIVIDGGLLKKQVGRDMTVAMALASMPLDLDDISLLVGIDVTEKSAVVSTSITTDDSEAQNQLDDIKKTLVPIKDGKVPFVADKYVALLATNLRGSDFKPYTAMLGGFDADELLDAINGLATLTVTSLDMDSRKNIKPALTFTAQATNMKCMDGVMDQLSGLGLPVHLEGKHTWTVPDGMGDNVLVGAQGGYVFANYGNNMQRPKGNNTIDLEDGTVTYLHAFFSQIPQAKALGVDEIEFYATDELTTQTTITLSRTWKEWLESIK